MKRSSLARLWCGGLVWSAAEWSDDCDAGCAGNLQRLCNVAPNGRFEKYFVNFSIQHFHLLGVIQYSYLHFSL